MHADTGGRALPELRDVSWGGGRFVAVGANGAVVHSADGLSWTEASATDEELLRIAWGGNRFVALGRDTIHYSTHGMTWTPASAPATEQQMFDVAWADGRFVAVGNGGAIVYSTEGDRWAAASETATEPDDSLRGVASNGTRFVAVGRSTDGPAPIVFSDDGDTWMAASDTVTPACRTGSLWSPRAKATSSQSRSNENNPAIRSWRARTVTPGSRQASLRSQSTSVTLPTVTGVSS